MSALVKHHCVQSSKTSLVGVVKNCKYAPCRSKYAPCRRILLQQISVNRKSEQMAPSPWELLNGQGMQRISGFKSECHGIRFGTLNVGSLF